MLFFGTVNFKEENKDKPASALSSRNLTLTWKNISYEVVRRRNGSYLKQLFQSRRLEYVRLLNGVNGVVTSGTLMAIMGPSGAGKTSLLAAISKRVKGQVFGDVLVNGELIDSNVMTQISGFVPQEDLAVESLTVQEHIEFMARMKMDRRYKSVVRKQRIESLLTELGLNKCTTTKLSALSGGERKRVALAVQLLTEPNILFCDEPTTGLDSYAAMAVTRTLREVAERGRIVICSLHQPASGLLDLFHQVLLLSGGRVAFQGSTKNATSYFSSLDMVCPPTFNDAEFFVSQLSITPGNEKECKKKAKWICDEFDKSDFGESLKTTIEESCTNTENEEMHPIFLETTDSSGEFKKVRFFTQIEWLTWRTYIDYRRNSSSLFLRFALYMFISLLLSSPYIGMTSNMDQRSIMNMQGLLYLVVTETVFTFSYGVFHTFPAELPLLLRDIANGLYNPAPYYISKVIVLIPGAIFQPFVYSAVIYVIVGLEGGLLGFFVFVLPVILCATSASAFGCLMSATFESVDTASLLAVPIDFLTLTFSGLFLHLGDLPPRLLWLKYISQFYYSTEAVSLTQWKQIDRLGCPSDPEEPCARTGMDVLDLYGYDPNHYFVDLLGLLAIFSTCHLAGFLALRRRSQKEPVY